MAKIVALDHVLLVTNPGGEAEQKAFFQNYFGMDEVQRPPELDVDDGAWLVAGTCCLHIGPQQKFVAPSRPHPAFRIDDLDALADHLQRDGHSVIWDTKVPALKRLFTYDTAGNRIECIQDGTEVKVHD